MAPIATLLRRFFRLAPVRIVAGVAFLFLALLWQGRKRDRIRLPFWARKLPESAAVQPPTAS